jgi:preprotein translocase subunit SecE
MTNTRLAAIGYVVLGLLTGLFLEHVLLLAFGSFGPTQPLTRPLLGGDSTWTWSSIIGLGIAAAAGVYLWRRPDTHEVSLEIVAELRKVTWPSLAETRAATIAVIVASVIAAVLLGLFDVLWQFVTDKIQNPSI